MSNTSVPAIEEKKNKQNINNTQEVGIGPFLKSILGWAVLVFIFGLLGSNLVTLINSDSEILDIILPHEDIYYYTNAKVSDPKVSDAKVSDAKVSEIEMVMKGGDENNKIIKKLARFGIDGNVRGWPYSMFDKMYYENVKELSIKGLINWFAKSTSGSYIGLRTMLKTVLRWQFFKLLNEIHEVLIFIMAPFVLLLAPIILSSISSYVILPFTGLTSGWFGWMWTILGFFLLWTLFLMWSNHVIQYLEVIAVLTLYPLMFETENTMTVMKKHFWWLRLLFGLLVVNSCFTNFGTIAGIVMAIAWFLGFIYSLYFL